jgi:hypothetical protein
MRSLDVLLQKFSVYNSRAEVFIYSQEDKIAIIITVISRIILRRIFRKWDGGHRLDRAGSG